MIGTRLKQAFLIRESLKGATVLLVGSVLAQAIAFFASPALTRLYFPSEMGTFALYTSAIAMLTLLSTARYDFAVISPRYDATAQVLVGLVNVIALAFLGIGMVLALGLVLISFSSRFDFRYLWVLAVPLGVFFTSVQLGYSAYLMRHVRTVPIAAVRIAMAACSSVLAIVFGCLGLGLWGLLASSLIALFVGGMLTWRVSGLRIWTLTARRRLFAVARRYIDYPRYDLPSSLFGAVGGQLPTLLLGGLFDTSFLGYYALVDRVLFAPLNIIGGAIGSVYRIRATQSAALLDEFRAEYVRTLLLLLPPALLFFAPLMFFGEEIFSYVFGSSWRTAGEIAQTLSPLYFVRFIASPLSMSLYVRNRMRFDMTGQISLLLTTATSLMIGWHFNDQWLAIKFMVAFNSVIYLIYIIYAHHISGKWLSNIRG